MKPFIKYIALSALLATTGAYAALDAGTEAPDFSALASLGGEGFEFNLAESLEQGPVVVYFYPKAFTSGCTIEARMFAEATDEFAQYDTSVIGVSTDDIETLHEFSVSECSSKFPVASDEDGNVVAAYDAAMANGMAARISYVIVPGGEIIHVLEDRAPEGHIHESMEAVKAWSASNNHSDHNH
ncbi:MAG: peroxiredoxin [Pseudomonadales bacterium]